jgi:hypothetical protein
LGKVIGQLKTSTIKIHKKFLEIFHFVEENVIYLEGGMGSQILGTLEFINSNKSVDISYFSNPPRVTINGPDIWKWELGRYGIDLNFFNARVRSKPYKWQYALKPQIPSYKLSTSAEYVNPWSIGGGIELFPIDKTATTRVLSSYGIEGNDFGAIHVRKGDYLRVSSRVISVDENAAILAKLQNQLPKAVFVFSDTALTESEMELIRVAAPHSNIHFLSEEDLEGGTVHDLMRLSKLLITANSTFSLSAGILASKETIVYSPLLFFGGKNDYLKSRIFNQAGDYFLLR